MAGSCRGTVQSNGPSQELVAGRGGRSGRRPQGRWRDTVRRIVPATIPFLLIALMLWPAVDFVTGEFGSAKLAAIVTFTAFGVIDVRDVAEIWRAASICRLRGTRTDDQMLR